MVNQGQHAFVRREQAQSVIDFGSGHLSFLLNVGCHEAGKLPGHMHLTVFVQENYKR